MNPRAQYISASRRTDLPRFFADEFFAAIKQGSITYNGGYGRSYTVSLKPEDVLGYIFWSKDYTPFVHNNEFKKLISITNAVFHYTINDMPDLEPGVPALMQCLDTCKKLCDLVGPERVFWRFDPIVRYKNSAGKIVTTADSFYALLPHIAAFGILRCYVSFVSIYKKVQRRSVEFFPIVVFESQKILVQMVTLASQYGIQLFYCCPQDENLCVQGITKAACIDEAMLRETDRFGVHQNLKVSPTREHCGCYASRDIGSYEPACGHGCVYCYANPKTLIQ
jgi:hypothetical protein